MALRPWPDVCIKIITKRLTGTESNPAPVNFYVNYRRNLKITYSQPALYFYV